MRVQLEKNKKQCNIPRTGRVIIIIIIIIMVVVQASEEKKP